MPKADAKIKEVQNKEKNVEVSNKKKDIEEYGLE